MKKTLFALVALLLVLALAACQPNVPDPTGPVVTQPPTQPTDPPTAPPTEPPTTPPTDPTDPPVVVEYPAGIGDRGNVPWFQLAKEETARWFDMVIGELGDFDWEVGKLYIVDEENWTATKFWDADVDSVLAVAGHVFFSSEGKLIDYIQATGEFRELPYTVQHGTIRSIDYHNQDDTPILYFLDGDYLICYDILTGETTEFGYFEGGDEVFISSANPNVVAIRRPGGWPFMEVVGGWMVMNTANADVGVTTCEEHWLDFYHEGIVPEYDPTAVTHPNPGIE